MHGEFYEAADFSGEPIEARDGFGAEFWWHIAWTPMQIKPKSMRWTGSLTVPVDGLYTITLSHTGKASVFVDDELILEGDSADSGKGRART